MLKRIRHFVGSFMSEQTRENLILFFKSKGTRESLFRKLKINKFTKKNCYYISSSEPTGEKPSAKVAIQFHIFYTDLLDEIYCHLKDIDIDYDLYVSTSDQAKCEEIRSFFDTHELRTQNITIAEVENRGRDVWPFLKMIHPVWKDYKYIAHLHTKKSVTQGGRGTEWRKYLYHHILGSGNYFGNVIRLLEEKEDVGMIAPPIFPDEGLIYAYSTRNSDQCKNNLNNFFKKIGLGITCKNALKYQYSAGNMFIARAAAIEQIMQHEFQLEDFPPEQNQQSNTLQHTMEQCWHFVIDYNKYKYKECFNKTKN